MTETRQPPARVGDRSRTNDRRPQSTLPQGERPRDDEERGAERPAAVERHVAQTGPKLYPLVEGEADALVLHCSDPRFQPAFRQFLADQGITHPAAIIGPGSISAFGVMGAKPKLWNALRSSIETMADRHPIRRVIIITHDECRSYGKLAALMGGLPKVPGLQRDHLKAVANFILKEYLPHAQVELFHAAILGQQGGIRQVRFEPVL